MGGGGGGGGGLLVTTPFDKNLEWKGISQLCYAYNTKIKPQTHVSVSASASSLSIGALKI